MNRRGLKVGIIALVFFTCGAGAAMGCVGDEPNDGSSSADGSTTDQATQGDQQTTSDAATEAASCGACDGSCYHGICNGNAVVQVSAGSGFSCAVLADGSVWCWGDNGVGEVTSPPGGSALAPTQISGLSNVTNVSAGFAAACAVEADGSVWCWGRNDEGDLGHDPGTSGDVVCGSNKCNAVPTKVSGVTAKEVGVGINATCAVTTTGNVACWGWNGQGVLGLGGAPSNTSSSTPQSALGLSSIAHLSVNMWPSGNVCAVDTSKKLWCWGDDQFGQLAHAVGGSGDVNTCFGAPGYNCNTTPAKILDVDGGDLTNVGSVASGWATCASLLGGSVRCWGINAASQLASGPIGNGSSVMTQVPSISNGTFVGGVETMCARLATGEVDCWGSDSYGVAGGNGVDDAGCMAFANGSVPCALAPAKIAGLNAKALSVSLSTAVAITSDGHVVAWGDNSVGQLGHAIGTSGDDPSHHNPTPTTVEGLP